MPGRRLLTDEIIPVSYQGLGFARRREVLRETIEAFTSAPPGYFQALAAQNLARWADEALPQPDQLTVSVHAMDWGALTLACTRKWGQTFAVLNMANAYVPGGGYVEGCPAQEENMFRRTDCHFAIGEEDMIPDIERYYPHKSALLNAERGRVYLDATHPRTCIRGPEDRSKQDLGYAWLAPEDVFPFFELRAAACDLRQGETFAPDEMRKRVGAQLDTLRDAKIRHAVLSAFGCGAFRNPAPEVAKIYRQELEVRRPDFHCVAFAIFYPGYGPNNVIPFTDAFDDWFAA